MMRIIAVDEQIAPGLALDGIAYMWLEIGEDGFAKRELGFDSANKVVHRFPGVGRFGDHGVFDSAKFDASAAAQRVSQEQFEKAWYGGAPTE